MAGPFTTPVAISVPMENRDARDNDFQSLNVQEGLEEIDFRRETKDPTGFLDLAESENSFNEGTRTFTIAPVGAEFTYFIKGQPFIITSATSIIIPNTSGNWFFYLDDNSTLTASQTHIDFGGNVITAGATYWNAVTQEAVWFGDMRSNLSMTWGAKRRAHDVNRVEGRDGDFILHDLVLDGDGDDDEDAQMAITDGIMYHIDIAREVFDVATPTADWEQHLDNIAQIPIYYKDNGNLLYKKTANNFPLIEDAGNTIFYNEEISPGNWQLTNVSNNNFVAIYLFITMDPRHPVVGVLGNISASSPAQALDLTMLTAPLGDIYPGFGFLKSLVFQTSTGFTNTPKARLFATSDVIDTLSTDRYMVSATYGGNAGNNRWLEIPPSTDASDIAPILMPEDSFIRTITLQSTSIIGNAKSIAFYNNGTEQFSVVVPAGGSNAHQFEVTEFFAKGDLISVRVKNGSISKPVVRFWIETSL